MTSMTKTVTAASVQSATASKVYGQLAKVPIRYNNQAIICRAPLDSIPRNAVVQSATLRFVSATNQTGTWTVRAQALAGTFNVSKVNWTNSPAGTGTVYSSSARTNPKAGNPWNLNVTAWAQQVVAGTIPNRGFRVIPVNSGNGTTTLYLRGTTAATGKPQLLVTYVVPPIAPTGLHPDSSSVAVARPALMFDTSADVTKVEVQVDPTGNATSPAFDSGEVAASGGLVDLADVDDTGAPLYPSFTDLADGEVRYWRARQANVAGWSPWSGWAVLTRNAQGAPTITQPPAIVEDGTPPIEWTAENQTAWRAMLLDGNGDVLSDSGYQPGTDTAWTPTKGLTAEGQTGTVVVQVWDDADRAVTLGDPGHSETTLEITYQPDATIEPVADLAASINGWTPVVELTGTRSAIPDQLAILRNGAEVARVAGTDVFTGTSFTVRDYLPPMNVETTYQVAPVVNGKRGPAGPETTIVPRCRGIWLADGDDLASMVPIWTGDSQDQSQPETSIVHQPIDDGLSTPVVRRRLLRSANQGTISGTLADVTRVAGVPSAAEAEQLLRSWALLDAGHAYRLCLGSYSAGVIIGDVTFDERPDNGYERLLDVSLGWWATS